MSDPTPTSSENSSSLADSHKALEDCLQFLLHFYKVRSDLRGILEASALKDGYLQPEDIMGIVHKLGLKARAKTLSLKKLAQQSDSPCIVLPSDESGDLFVLLPEKTHDGKAYLPGGQWQDDPFRGRDLNDTVEVIFIHPEYFDTGLETGHMREGHALDWFWTPIIKFWSSYSEILIASIFINFFVLITPLFTLNVYDRVVPNFAEATLIVLTVGVCIAILFDFILKTVRAYILEHVAGKVGVQYDFDLMERMMLIHDQDMPLSVGEKVNIFRELQSIRDFYAAKLAPTVVDLPFLLLFLFVIHLICPPLVLVPLIGALIIFVLNFYARKVLGRLTEKHFTAMQKKSAVLIETLSGSKTFKMFNGIGNRLFQWNSVVMTSTERSRYNQFFMGVVSNLCAAVMQSINVFLVFAGVYQIQAGNLTIGGLIACSILSSRAMGPVMNLSTLIAQLRQAQGVLNTIDKIFQLPHEGQSLGDQSAKETLEGRIELHEVSFAYPGQPKAALQNVSLAIEPGESVGLIGRSGAGKSTLANLISGFLNHYQGRVLIDSYELASIPPSELRRLIGVVPQDPFFFSGTLQDNILAGRTNFDKVAFDRAIELSGMDLVMSDSGYGLDMQVAENGHNLSGGQRQAISLARAFLHDPKVLIFDEPTTGMDQVLESRIKQTLKEYIQGRTFIMITHRTTLLPLVDRLILMDKGTKLADGPRDEIIKKLSGNA